MKIAFFGTSDKSEPILNALKENFDLSLCVTKADVKVGRKKELKETRVKKWAKENNIDFLEIASIKKSQDIISQEIKRRNIELGVMADFGFIIPESLIRILPKGIINIHFSMLPKYRGASPVQFAILNGEETAGISYFLLDSGLDTGRVLQQNEYKIGNNFTAEDLYEDLFSKAAQGISKVIKKYISGEITSLPQDESLATYTYSRTHPNSTLVFKEDAKIDWHGSNEQIERMVRAYFPWPIAWTTLSELARAQDLKLKNEKNGNLLVKIFEAKVINNNFLIEKLLVEGGKLLEWNEFKNGYLETS